MLRTAARILLIRSDWRERSSLRAGIFWELPLWMLLTTALIFPTKQQKITALGNGAIPPFSADQEDPARSGASV